jgi:hypothetical protein
VVAVEMQRAALSACDCGEFRRVTNRLAVRSQIRDFRQVAVKSVMAE